MVTFRRLGFSSCCPVAVAAILAACAGQGDGSSAGPPAEQTPKAPSSPGDASSPETAPQPCKDGITETCSAFDERSYCTVSSNGTKEWRTEKCAGGCFAGKCSPTACVDECVLGEASAKGTCRLWDVNTKAFIDAAPATSMHDRARDYEQRLRTTSLKFNQVLNVNYTDADRSTVAAYSGYRDAAIWTGSALAAAGWRLATTRSPDAERQVQSFVKTLHADFTATGVPGYPARFVIPANDPIPLRKPKSCGSNDWQCNSGGHDWIGGTSRDQYTGVMLGYLVGYLSTTDEPTRAIIRQDVVTVARELTKKRSVPVRVKVNGIPVDKTIEVENVILSPSEMPGGRVLFDLAPDEPTSSEMLGMREFVPDFSMLVKPILGIGTPLPRAESAIMLGAFFEMALRMSADDPAMTKDRDELKAYFDANVGKWLDIAEQWKFATADGCGKSYFATHITYIMAWAWASLVKDPAIAERVRDIVLDKRMWSALSHHKNSYFAFMWGSTRPTPDKSVIDAAAAQLAQFEPGPRVRYARDSLTLPQYMPHETSCEAPMCDMETNAVDVKDRRVDDFIWQRQPWQLLDPGEPTIVFPGVDYLAAYWIARRYELLADDRAGTCARYDGAQ